MPPLPNQQITLYVESTTGSSIHVTKIEDIHGDLVLVAAPIERRTIVPISIGSQVQLEYRDTGLTSSGRYMAKRVVVGRQRGQVPILEVQLLRPWAKIQERMFVRVDVLLDTTYAQVVDSQVQSVCPCSVRNLSGGGLWMLAKEELEQGQLIWVCLPLEPGAIQVYGEIVRVEKNDEGFGYGVSFVNQPERDRQTIIQYVYQRQLELRRKGLVQPQPSGS